MGYIVDEMSQLFPIDNDQITDDQKLSLWKIMAKHSNAVSRGPHDIGHCTKAQLRINTGTAPPSRLPLRRFSPQKEKYMREETQRLLERDAIEPSTSPWSAQVVLASKKDGSYRYFVDFRKLNSVAVKEHYPIPRVEDMIDTLAGANFSQPWTLSLPGRKQLSLQSRGTGNGNVFPLGFVTQLLSLRGRLPVS